MQTYISTWYISVLAAILFIVQGFVAVQKMKSVMKKIQSTIKSWDDLALVKAAINLNMLTCALLIVEVIIYVCTVEYLVFSRYFSHGAAAAHFAVLGTTCLVGGLCSRRTHNDFKKMRVESDDPQIASTFERWLKQWNPMRLKLPD